MTGKSNVESNSTGHGTNALDEIREERAVDLELESGYRENCLLYQNAGSRSDFSNTP